MEKQQSENVLQQKEKHQRNAADLLVECLQEEGVEYIFGIPGEENLAVMNAIDQSPIRFITTRHEQGAAFMADVYGRLTGKAGVCLATLGPGATNLVTGVADADGDGAPLVAITGQVGTERMHITGHQFLADRGTGKYGFVGRKFRQRCLNRSPSVPRWWYARIPWAR